MFKIYAVSQVGSMHSCNEDRAIINGSVLHSGEVEQWCDRSELTVAIFDGVGGEQGGAVASTFAARRIAERASNVNEKALKDINDKLISFAAENGWNTMATTIACVRIEDDKAEVYFAGNSRVFALRFGCLQHISRDDTVAAASSYGDKITDTSTPITACMGGGDKSLFKLKKEVIEKPKMLLLTSDGIHDHIEDKDLEEIVLNSQPDEVCKLLIEKACKNGSWDDKTAVLVMLN